MKTTFSSIAASVLFVALADSVVVADDIRSIDSTAIRVISYNIHRAEGMDECVDLSRIASVIRSASPDIVALQEVDRNVPRSGNIDQPRELARLTGMHYAYGKNIDLDGGEYGNAILSRFPISSSRNYLLPSHNDGEQRGVLEAELQCGSFTITFFSTHLDARPNDDTERIMSAKFINAISSARSEPTLLAGDLNALPDSQVLRTFYTSWTSTSDGIMPTASNPNPNRQIDYILFKAEQDWRVSETRVIDEAVASDHRPIMTVIHTPDGSCGQRQPECRRHICHRRSTRSRILRARMFAARNRRSEISAR